MEPKVIGLQGLDEATIDEASKDVKRSKTKSTRQSSQEDSQTLRTTLFKSSDMQLEDHLDVESKVRVVAVLLKRGKAEDALEIVEKTLPLCPDHVALIAHRGDCYLRLGNAPAAYACFTSCLKLDSGNVDALMGMGSLYKAKGMLPECVEVVTAALEVMPDNKAIQETLGMALTDLGTKSKEAGDLDEGIASYLKALSVCENYAPAHYNLGVVYNEMGLTDRALEAYNKAVEYEPGSCMAWCNMGNIHKNAGNLEGAIECYEKALRSEPNSSLVNENLAQTMSHYGTVLKLQGKVAEGVAAYERALAHDPKCVDALYNLGVAFGEHREFDRAIFMYEMAIAQKESAEAYNNLGAIYKEKDNMERAVKCYMAALNIRPNFPQSLNNLGVVYTAEGRAQEAMALLQAAVSACPTYAEAYNNVGVLQRDVGLIKDAIASYQKCLDLSSGSRNAGQNKLLGLNYIIPGEDQVVSDAHANWGREFEEMFVPLAPIDLKNYDMNTNRILRVGYISPDLYTHSVSYFAEAPLACHNAARVHHIVYNCSPKVDGKLLRLKSRVEEAKGEWKEATLLSEQELAQMIRQDQVDILVELTGQFANNRLGTMAMKPAPIQVTWIGYPNSTGLKSIDYRFTDALCDPLETQQKFVEELVRLPGCFLCYTPMQDLPMVAPAPCLDNGFVTFGSFNGLAKITKEVIKVWSEILHAIPNSRMVLKNKPFACETTKAYFMNMFKTEGIESWRVDLLPLAQQTHQHLNLYSLLDISLDPWPYTGTTTTCESMIMGVPCITLSGACHAHNVGVSLLHAVGLESEWIAHTTKDYVQLAIHHSKNLEVLSSPLCDDQKFVSSLEDTYASLWARWLKSNAQTPYDQSSLESSDMMGNVSHYDFQSSPHDDDRIILPPDSEDEDTRGGASIIPRPSTPSPIDDSD